MGEGRRERTIGSGHLVALFLGIVVLCCVFFILGYEMGRAQFERGSAATVASKTAAPTTAPAAKPETPAAGWPSGAAGSSAVAEKSAADSVAARTAPAGKARASGAQKAAGALMKAPEIPKGSIVLQVAANRNETDALKLAKLLQEKGFPAFVQTPSTDKWYRVQVGPFADGKAAEQARTALAQKGFKAIAKH